MSNTSDAVTDGNAYSGTNSVAEHVALFESNTNIADAMGYTALPQNVKDALWVAFDDAVPSGVADLGTPTGYPTLPQAKPSSELTMTLTRADAQASYVAHVAHAFWVELTRAVPWSITQYDLESCQFIFDVYYVFYEEDWDGWGADPVVAAMNRIKNGFVNYSPKKAWDKAVAMTSSPQSPKIAAREIFDNNRIWTEPVGIQHGGGDVSVVDIDDLYAVGNQLTDPYSSATFPNQGGETVYECRIGCWFVALLLRSLLVSMNIPAARIWDKYVGRAHASLLMPTLGKVAQDSRLDDTDLPQKSDKGLVLNHADDVFFHTPLYPITGLNMCVNRRYWDKWITPTSDDHDLYKYTIRAAYFTYLLYPDVPEGGGHWRGYVGSSWRAVKAQLANSIDLVDDAAVIAEIQQSLTDRDGGTLNPGVSQATHPAVVGNAEIASDDFGIVGEPNTNLGWYGNLASQITLQEPTTGNYAARFGVDANKDRRMGGNIFKGVCLFQLCEDEDFEIESKWLTMPTDDGEWGMGALTAAGAWVGAAFYEDTGTLKLKAGNLNTTPVVDADVSATITGSIGYLKITRTKSTNNWSIQYSANGSSWVEPAGSPFVIDYDIAKVMLYAASSNVSGSAYSPDCDYFFENAARISPEDS